MAIKTLDQLPVASTLTGDELSLVMQNGLARKLPLGTLVLATDARLQDARTPLAHTHTVASLGLSTVATSGSYADLINTPTAFVPSTHTHVGADVTDLGSVIATSIAIERTAVATLTSKTLTAPTITGAYTEQASAFASSSTAYTIDLSTGTIKGITLTGACTVTFPTVGAGKQFTLFLKQDTTGSRLVTWPATVRWAGDTAPMLTTAASKTDVIRFVCEPSGTYWVGFVGGFKYTLA